MGVKNKNVAGGEPVEVSASDLKNAWHEYLDQVDQARQEVVVTRYGRPVAKLVPYEGEGRGGRIFGCLAGSVTIHGDIVAPLGEAWEADG
jgi:prevent-host-death family protein